MLINKETTEALTTLYGAFFDMNASLDVCSSIMINKWSMPQAGDIVHHKLSHLMPLLADDISKIQDNYNVVTYRPEVHRDFRDYNNLSDMFETMLKEFSEIYEMIKLTIDVALTHKDYNVHSDLIEFIRKFNIVMAQMITLRDKSIQMPTSYDTFDRHISSWGIVGLDEGDD